MKHPLRCMYRSLLVAVVAMAAGSAASAAEVLVSAAQMLDVRSGKMLANPQVLIRDGRVVEVRHGAAGGAFVAGPATTVIDLAGMTLLGFPYWLSVICAGSVLAAPNKARYTSPRTTSCMDAASWLLCKASPVLLESSIFAVSRLALSRPTLPTNPAIKTPTRPKAMI